jgi:hypothetical protein
VLTRHQARHNQGTCKHQHQALGTRHQGTRQLRAPGNCGHQAPGKFRHPGTRHQATSYQAIRDQSDTRQPLHQVPGTRHPPATGNSGTRALWYQAQSVRHQYQAPGNQVPAPRHQAPGTRHQTPGTRHQAPGTRQQHQVRAPGTPAPGTAP